jgi:hypothetical protein
VLGFVTALVTNRLPPSVRFHRQARHLREYSVPAHEYPSAMSRGCRDQQVVAGYRGAPSKRLRTNPTGFGRLCDVERKDLQAVEEFQSSRQFLSPPEVGSDKDLGRSHGRGRETFPRLHEVSHFPDRVCIAPDVVDQES